MSIITPAQLATVAPKADPKIAAAILNHADDVLPRHGLATRARLTDFMAHVLVESAYLTTAAEDLNYSATRLMEVWPSRFPTLGSCSGFAHTPEALACKVYNGRMGNNEARDGWTYRGQGLLQITGKDRYQELAKALGKTLAETVLFITSAEGMLECAAAVYVMLGAPAHADKGDIVGSTRCINGGTNGLTDRKAMLAKCQKVWPTAARPTPELDLIRDTIDKAAATLTPSATPHGDAIKAALGSGDRVRLPPKASSVPAVPPPAPVPAGYLPPAAKPAARPWWAFWRSA